MLDCITIDVVTNVYYDHEIAKTAVDLVNPETHFLIESKGKVLYEKRKKMLTN